MVRIRHSIRFRDASNLIDYGCDVNLIADAMRLGSGVREVGRLRLFWAIMRRLSGDLLWHFDFRACTVTGKKRILCV